MNSCEVLKYPDAEVKRQREAADEKYRATAESYGYDDFELFLKEQFGFEDKESYEKGLQAYAEDVVKTEMILYSIAEKEEIQVTEEEYEARLQKILKDAGIDAATFEERYGYSISEYGEETGLRADLLKEKVYDRIFTTEKE